MKIETIENEKKTEWTIPCLVIHEQGTIVLLSGRSAPICEKNLDRYEGFVVKDDDEGMIMIGELFESIDLEDGWTLYDGKVILSNN